MEWPGEWTNVDAVVRVMTHIVSEVQTTHLNSLTKQVRAQDLDFDFLPARGREIMDCDCTYQFMRRQSLCTILGEDGD